MKEKFVTIVDKGIDGLIRLEQWVGKYVKFLKRHFSEFVTFFAFVTLILNIINMNITHSKMMNDLQNKYDNLCKTHSELTVEIRELKELIVESPMYNYENTSDLDEPVKIETVEVKSENILEKAGEKYNIEPELLEAIERLESGHYRSALFKAKNNSWGAFNGREYLSFASREESAMELASTLREGYFDKGLTTIEKIATKYCPDDGEWASKVRNIYNNLKAGHEYE